jgi:5'-phosphate synthase pdxT subunit
VKVGIVGVQGAVSEHEKMVRSLGHEAIWVAKPDKLQGVRAIIIPGGESTAIGKLLDSTGLLEHIKNLGKDGLPIYGTCAGLILLAKKGDKQVEATGQNLLGLMDMEITRNAFGRQRESFEAAVDIRGVAKKFPGVFIRAPAVTKVWGECRALASFGKFIVAAEQGNLLATAFHPELSGDTRIHEHFLSKA